MPKDIFLYDQTSSISRLPHSLKHLTVSPIPQAPIKQDQTILQENMLTSIINITLPTHQLNYLWLSLVHKGRQNQAS
jgi:hypothetical protein